MSSTLEEKRNAQAEDKPLLSLSQEKKHERRQRVLKHGATALVRSIASAIVVKNEDVFFLTETDGSVPLQGYHGLGLYFHDCRYLKGYELHIARVRPEVLASAAHRTFMADLDLTNPEIHLANGHLIRREQIGIRWTRILDGGECELYDSITIQNFGLDEIEFPVTLTFDAAFDDVFQVRGAEPEKRGYLHPPVWDDHVLRFAYDGADGVFRGLSVHFLPEPVDTQGACATFNVHLQPRERKEILISLLLSESTDAPPVNPPAHPDRDRNSIRASLQKSLDAWLENQTLFRCDNLLVHRVMERSLSDLAVLRSRLADQEYFAAGIPWFATLFGRDSLITALQTLAFDPSNAEQTLRLLAHYQGQRVDEWRDEEPGKILHELRVGEMAHLNEIPQTPYYGSVDSTPLFLVLMARHAEWTGDLRLFNELRSNVDRALEWIARYGDGNGDGYVEYRTRSKSGLVNQGWKDSGDSISNADGSLANPPISLVEVQGYVYLAKHSLADLYERAGEADRAGRLRKEAQDLRTRFNRDFWLEDQKFYAIALQADGTPAAVVASNPGHALWTGIVDEDKIDHTVKRLMRPDMFTGWGIRTLSELERRYSPIGYHLGTVWPHDNSIIAAGMRRYGHDEAFGNVFQGLLATAIDFRFYRLPELFAGFSKSDYDSPVRYPVACHPQAWAAGVFPFLFENLLGLVPEAFEKRLRIVRPILPDLMDHVEVRRLKVGAALVDLDFDRQRDGSVVVNVNQIKGELNVVVEPAS
ncbi:MAG: glycogen debranching N-terminal domain-containing protein [Acidobacteriota bacterium]